MPNSTKKAAQIKSQLARVSSKHISRIRQTQKKIFPPDENARNSLDSLNKRDLGDAALYRPAYFLPFFWPYFYLSLTKSFLISKLVKSAFYIFDFLFTSSSNCVQ